MSSSLRNQGVAKVLEEVRKQVEDEMRKWLRGRRHILRADLSEQEVEKEIGEMATKAAAFARTAAGNGVGEAYQWGKNSLASKEDHERPTKPPAKLE